MSLIGVDWSEERFRAYRLGADGTVLERRESADGLRRAARRGYEETLRRHIGSWLEADTLAVLALSVGDGQGGIGTPFLDGPVDIARLLEEGVWKRLEGATLLLVPGLARREPEASDAMRREALLALGSVGTRGRNGDGECLVVVPGTRSRWIRIAGGRIESFRTTMGGELLGLLLEGPFARLVSSKDTTDGPPFLAGVDRGYRSRHFVTDLSSARAAAVLDESDPESARAHLAGLVLGNEIREAETALEATGEGLTLVGPNALCAPYARALRHLGTSVVYDDDETAAIAAFAAIGAARSAPNMTNMLSARARRARPFGSAVTERAARRSGAGTLSESVHGPSGRDWDGAFAELPLIAVLPPLARERLVETAATLVEAGLVILVVSARDDGALERIGRLAESLGERVCIGVRDAPTARFAASAIDAGARVVLATGTDSAIARRCRKRGVSWVPGVATVTEASSALALGARALTLYPAQLIEPRVLHAFKRALPPDTALLPSGGLTVAALLPYVAAGAAGAIADDALNGPDASPAVVAGAARSFVEAWRRLERGRRVVASRGHSPPGH